MTNANANTSTKPKTKTYYTPEFQVSWPNVFEAKAAAPGQDPKFSISMIWLKTANREELRKAVHEAIVKKWGADSTKWPKGLKLPFRDGSEKTHDGYGPNKIFASATSKQKPGLVDKDVNPIINRPEFYGGCYAIATVTVYAYDKGGGKGVAFGLRNIQKTRDGDSFSSGNRPEDDFDAIPEPGGTAGIENAGAETNPLASL